MKDSEILRCFACAFGHHNECEGDRCECRCIDYLRAEADR